MKRAVEGGEVVVWLPKAQLEYVLSLSKRERERLFSVAVGVEMGTILEVADGGG